MITGMWNKVCCNYNKMILVEDFFGALMNIQDIKPSFLLSTVVFKGVKPEQLAALLKHLRAVVRTYKPGEIILCAGDKAHQFGIVVSGAIHVEGSDAQGNISVMGAFHTGEIFGEAYAALGNVPLLTSVVATETSAILLLDLRQITTRTCDICGGVDIITRNLMASIAQKNIMLSRRIQDAAPKSIRGKLMAYLNTRSQATGSAEFDIPYNRQQLADYLGVDRSALSAVISSLSKEGVFEVKRSHFKLL